jgi:hypothetical protein
MTCVQTVFVLVLQAHVRLWINVSVQHATNQQAHVFMKELVMEHHVMMEMLALKMYVQAKRAANHVHFVLIHVVMEYVCQVNDLLSL